MPKRTTPAQLFKQMFVLWMDPASEEGERETAKRKLDAWLKRHNKTWKDAPTILAQAAADDAAAQPSPSRSARCGA